VLGLGWSGLVWVVKGSHPDPERRVLHELFQPAAVSIRAGLLWDAPKRTACLPCSFPLPAPSPPPADITVKLLLSIGREQTLAQAMETVELALELRDRGVVGIDLTGNPTAGEVRSKGSHCGGHGDVVMAAGVVVCTSRGARAHSTASRAPERAAQCELLANPGILCMPACLPACLALPACSGRTCCQQWTTLGSRG